MQDRSYRGLDYGGLRKRVAELTGKPNTEQSITFVEVPTSGMVRAEKSVPEPRPDPAPESGLVIDISRPDGTRVRISLKPGIDLDAAFRSATLALSGIGIPASDGIVGETGETSLATIERLAQHGTASMDAEILDIMKSKLKKACRRSSIPIPGTTF